MCKHCENLNEDRDVVHTFMQVAAKRLQDRHPGITPDDIDIELKVTVREWQPNPLAGSEAQRRVYRLLAEFAKEGAF